MLKRIVSAFMLTLVMASLVHAAPLTYAPAVKKAAPAVVNVFILRHGPAKAEDESNTQGYNRLHPVLKDRMVLGSGVIMDKEGYVLTNSHVVRDRDSIYVALSDGRSIRAKLVGVDTESDLAVLKLDLHNLPVIDIANSETLQVGDVVLAIGNPFGLGKTVTQGIISALGRTAVGLSNIENFIQTDVALNPGSSGGALINTQGQLIGINTGIYTRSGGYQGVSFAIPVNAAQNILQQIIKHGVVKRGWLGIDVVNLDPSLIHNLKTNQTMGLVVTKLLAGSPAENKLEPHDIITQVNGNPVHDVTGFMNIIAQSAPGHDITLTYYRHNQPNQITLRLSADKRSTNEWQHKVVRGKKHVFPDDR